VTGRSNESFQAAALDALAQVPPSGERKSARIVDQSMAEGGIVAGVEYYVTVVTTLPPSNA
jgi:hypothetical protein